MHKEQLDLTPLRNAISSYKEVLNDSQKLKEKEESGELALIEEFLKKQILSKGKKGRISSYLLLGIISKIDYIRDSCIQRFEYCYDLSLKFMTQHLKNIADSPSDIKHMDLQNKVRLAATKGIILHSWDVWFKYRENRNKTSHGYNEAMAIDIVEQLPLFLAEAEYLLERLEKYYET